MKDKDLKNKKEDKTEENKKTEETEKKIDSKKALLHELEELSNKLEDMNEEDAQGLIDELMNLKIKRNPIQSIGSFILSFLVSFSACYLAYGIIFNHIEISPLNALWLNLGNATIITMTETFIMKRASLFTNILITIGLYSSLVIAMMAFSNLNLFFKISSFGYIVLYYFIEFIAYEMMAFLVGRLKLRFFVR